MSTPIDPLLTPSMPGAPRGAACPGRAAVLALATGGAVHDGVSRHVTECPRCRRELADRAAFAAVLGPAALAPARPPVVPGYRVGRCLGWGGGGGVWYAEEERTGRALALKVLHPERADTALAEVASLDLPSHPHRVPVLPAPGGVLVMPYIPGGALARHSPMPWSRAVRFAAQAADGLVALHGAGRCHGDVTPANLLYDERHDICLVSDFGHSTAARGVGGTRGFAAPELGAHPGGPPADVFGLGATLFFLLTGRAPFDAPGFTESLVLAARGLPEGALPDGLPARLVELLRRATDPDPNLRPSVEALRDGLVSATFDPMLKRLGAAAPGAALGVVASVWSAGRALLRRARFGAADPGAPAPALEGETGGTVECELFPAAPGYLTAIILRASGEIGTVPVVYPSGGAPALVYPGVPPRVAITLLPPHGTDEVAFVWTPDVPPPDPAGWLALVGCAEGEADRAVEVHQLPPRVAGTAVVRLAVSHAPPE